MPEEGKPKKCTEQLGMFSEHFEEGERGKYKKAPVNLFASNCIFVVSK